MRKIKPIILAGGVGTRLWPLSRKSYPKQFSKILEKESLLQLSLGRVKSSKNIEFLNPSILTNEDFRFIVREQCNEISIKPDSIIIEPISKNTGPAILAASLLSYEENKDSILLVTPSDHVIKDIKNFHLTIKKGIKSAENGNIVTLGIKPKRPETGYGYIEISDKEKDQAFLVYNFIEKPKLENAKSMINSNKFLWNAGIFLFRSIDMITAFKREFPNLIDYVQNAINRGKNDLDFYRLEFENWSKCDNISVDYAIIEKIKNLVAIPFDSGWNDMGGWDSVLEEKKVDKNGVSCSSNATAIDCKDVLLSSESSSLALVGLGLKNIIAVAMPDAVLVVDKKSSQKVREVVPLLKEKSIKQAEKFPKDYRPWGWFEILSLGDRFQVKRIKVKPGASLSLQSHHHRSEHWVVVKGTARVTLDGNIKILSEGESIYIPLGKQHRLENPGKLSVVLIEIQTGPYLNEDDIIRYEDKYNR